MAYILIPACFAAEIPQPQRTRQLVNVSLLSALLLLLYMWLLLAGFGPPQLSGLAARFAVTLIVCWHALAGNALLRPAGQE